MKYSYRKRIVSMLMACFLILSSLMPSLQVFSADKEVVHAETASSGDALGLENPNGETYTEGETTVEEVAVEEDTVTEEAANSNDTTSSNDPVNTDSTANKENKIYTQIKENVKQSEEELKLAELARQGFYAVMSEDTDVAEVAVFSSSDESEIEVEVATETDAEEGLEVLESYTFGERDEKSEETLWVKADQGEDTELLPGESLSVYTVSDDKVEDVIIEDIAEEDELCEIDNEVTGIALVKDTGYRHLSFEIGSEGELDEDSDVNDGIVKLDGMMPKEASAEAVDVTEQRNAEEEELFGAASVTDAELEATLGDATLGDATEDEGNVIAAYDITIKNGDEEYQPGEERPIAVEIIDSRIKADADLQLWHIKDDGTREQVYDFAIEDGKVSFAAVGFSVYEVVDASYATDFSELTGPGSEYGFYLYYYNGNNIKFITNTVNNNGAFTDNVNINNAAIWYFEKEDDKYYIYTYVNEVKQYLYSDAKNNKISLSDSGIPLSISHNNGGIVNTWTKFYIKKEDENRWFQHTSNGFRFDTKTDTAANCQVGVMFVGSADSQDAAYNLDGKTYGLISYSSGNRGYGLVVDDNNNHSMRQMNVRSIPEGETEPSDIKTMYIDGGQDITMWTFEHVNSNNYYLKAEVNGTTKYLQVNSGEIAFVDTPDNNCIIKVTPGTTAAYYGKIHLSVGNRYVTYDASKNRFKTTTSSNDANSWLNTALQTQMKENDYVRYSAEKISVSDTEKLTNGTMVIIYTRIWNSDAEAYEYYMVDHDGSLYPCSGSEDKISWLGDVMESLQWKFIEHYWDEDADPKVPNYYYDLYNPYSGKYLSPQMRDGQILSDDRIGLNMPGRREGEYYSDIIAWDDYYKAYASVGTNDGSIVSLPYAQSETFYFAIYEDKEEEIELHTVSTVDNSKYGINMRMIDFGGPDETDKSKIEVTKDYFNGDTNNTKGLLKNKLQSFTDESGNEVFYPVVTQNSEKNFYDLYKEAETVNHLFIQSLYEESGYFEFDSCQNFATLYDQNGNKQNDFIVYEELGTTNASYKTTLNHGQFFPYNIIKAGVYSQNNPKNMYNMNARPNQETTGLLDDSNPRKYEKLHVVHRPNGTTYNNANFFYGMEMSASFIQTPRGLDAWGHDVIFEFTGDDDFWLYVDGELVLDLGGVHSAEGGKVNFRTGKVTINGVDTTLYNIFAQNMRDRGDMTEEQISQELDRIFALNDEGNHVFKNYSEHTMNIYYMERGAGASNLHMKFNLSSVSEGDVLLKKELSGDAAKNIDFELMEYPYQIWYRTKTEAESEDDPERQKGHRLTNEPGQDVGITYQNSTKSVKFEKEYTPPNGTYKYDDVYFLTPGKNAEIHFKDKNTYQYKIIECGINTEVYNHVYFNGAEIQGKSVGNPNRKYYESDWIDVDKSSTALFTNHVADKAIRTLYIKKKLYNENGCDDEGNLLTYEDDPTMFKYRLSLSNEATGNIERADRYKYYIVSPDFYLCKWNPELQKYEETSVVADDAHIRAMSDAERIATTFYTSIYGTIDNVPAGYEVWVPGLPVGASFIVEEIESEIPDGYVFDHYSDEISSGSEATYYHDQDVYNAGTVRAGYSPKVYVNNRRCWHLAVEKNWTDEAYTSDYDPIYIALYDENDQLVEETVRCIDYPATSAEYDFFTTFDNYYAREVTLSNPNPTVTDGVVTDYGTATPVDQGGDMEVDSVDIDGNSQNYTYVASYSTGEATGSKQGISNVRTDTVTNIRKGGLMMRLFKWNSTDPLPGGVFELTCGGVTIDEFTVDESGIISVIYENFDPEKTYTLTQKSSPAGWIGLAEPVTFTVGKNGIAEGGFINPNSEGWANNKPASDGIVAYVDIYNKPFVLKVRKYAKNNYGLDLPEAHFAVYKQTYNELTGYARAKSPVTKFEDLVTGADGIVSLISMSEEMTLKAGTYYLSEKAAPADYVKMKEDIIFTISDRGTITIDSEGHQDYLKAPENEGDPYLIEVPNANEVPLTITKTVAGNMGNKVKDFVFTFTTQDGDKTEYTWTKNGDEQAKKLKTGDTFTLKHGEEVVITVPAETTVKISEDAKEYTASFKLNDRSEVTASELEFTVEDASALAVTNTLTAEIPTGVWISYGFWIIAGALMLAGMFFFRSRARRYSKEK